MNPSQNDSCGSFSNGQGGFGGYSTGGQIFSPAPGAVSSGGDIVVGGRKSRKWLVVLIVVLLFAAVAGGVFAVWKSMPKNIPSMILLQTRDTVPPNTWKHCVNTALHPYTENPLYICR